MNGMRNWVVALIVVALAAAGGGYFLGRSHDRGPAPMPEAGTQMVSTAAPSLQTGAPIYYQDPDGKPDYSPTPKKTPDGRDYKPVYENPQGAIANTQASPATSGDKGRVLYYRNPMGLADTSPVPKKDSMGMDYIAVYENEAGANAGIVTVSPARVQMLGVRTTTVTARPGLLAAIRATATVQFDERHLATVTTKVGGWVEKLNVAATGESVRAGQPLLELYAPDIVAAEQEYLVVAGMNTNPQGVMAHGDSELLDAATRRLRALDVSQAEIQRLRRTGEAARRIAVLAPANGIVTEKDAVLGMHVDPGTPLYKTADLASVWLIAQVQEQDLGRVKPGQAAHATFVAFPRRVFDGVVDFVYPDLMADTRTAKIRIVMPNTDRLVRAGMYASITIDALATTATASTLAVPDSAVIDSGAAQIVLVVKGEGRYEPRAVRIGARGEGYTQILSGLQVGEQIVVSANFLIAAESNLRAALQTFTTGDAKKPNAPSAGSAP